MNSKQTLLVAGFATVLSCVVISVFFVQPRPANQPAPPAKEQAALPTPKTATVPASTPEPVPEPPPAQVASSSNRMATAPPPKMPVQPSVTPPSGPVAADPALSYNGYQVADPMARMALSYVGGDPDATAYWLGAINDPDIPAEERKDLIEDLNQDGLINPDHPTPDDMPVIAARIKLIEQIGPDAMDQVNSDAFAEAYKDLVNLLNGAN